MIVRNTLLLLGLLAVIGSASVAQEIGGPSDPPEPTVTPEDVRSAIVELMADTGPDASEAISTEDPDIKMRALDILLAPLTLDELQTEIAGWSAELQSAISDLSAAEMALFRLNAAEAELAAIAPTDAEPDAEPSPEKRAIIDEITSLREIRTARADRLKRVLDGYQAKGGDVADTAEIRSYISEVGGVRVDTQSLESTLLTFQQWAISKDGGQRILRNIGIVLVSTVLGYAAGWVLGLILNLGLRRTELSSLLLRRFILKWAERVTAFAGLLYGLSFIGVNMTPILAALGAAGFILAFALQQTISNFASGLLILFQRPFDAGDEIEAAGVTGEVERVSLFSTHLSTDENRKVIVPNNMIWEDVVVNSTGAPTRRLLIEIEVNAAEHGLEEAEDTLMHVMDKHPGVLADPPPELTLSAMTADSITFTCWPWVKTEDKDKVRWQLVSQFGKELNLLKGVTKSGSA